MCRFAEQREANVHLWNVRLTGSGSSRSRLQRKPNQIDYEISQSKCTSAERSARNCSYN